MWEFSQKRKDSKLVECWEARGHKLQVLSDHNERNYFSFQSVPPLIFFSFFLPCLLPQFCYYCYFGRTEQCVRFRRTFYLKNVSGHTDDFHKGNSNREWN